MIKRSLFAVALAFAITAPAAASEEKGKETPDSERVVCKTIRTTGSRLQGERVCKTKSQWDEEKAQARQKMDEVIEDRSSTVNTSG
jgi:hypothetical protein